MPMASDSERLTAKEQTRLERLAAGGVIPKDGWRKCGECGPGCRDCYALGRGDERTRRATLEKEVARLTAATNSGRTFSPASTKNS